MLNLTLQRYSSRTHPQPARRPRKPAAHARHREHPAALQQRLELERVAASDDAPRLLPRRALQHAAAEHAYVSWSSQALEHAAAARALARTPALVRLAHRPGPPVATYPRAPRSRALHIELVGLTIAVPEALARGTQRCRGRPRAQPADRRDDVPAVGTGGHDRARTRGARAGARGGVQRRRGRRAAANRGEGGHEGRVDNWRARAACAGGHATCVLSLCSLLHALTRPAGYPPDHINAVLTHTLHFLSLLVFYLGIKLPFEVVWSRSSTPPTGPQAAAPAPPNLRGNGLLGVGTPWIGATKGGEHGGWAK